MRTKFKLAIDRWIHGIIASEVERINRDLQGEKAALRAQIAVFDGAFKAHLQTLKDVVDQLSEVRENNTLREHIKELHAQITVMNDTFKKLHPETTRF